jgi:hypothetical protein
MTSNVAERSCCEGGYTAWAAGGYTVSLLQSADGDAADEVGGRNVLQRSRVPVCQLRSAKERALTSLPVQG